MRSLKLCITLMATIAVSIACTEKRPDSKSPNSNNYGRLLSEFDGKTFPVSTGAVHADSSMKPANSKVTVNVKDADAPVTPANERATSVSIKDMNTVYSIVDFDTPADLAMKDKIVFHGIPETTDVYQIMYKIYDRRLVVLKVAKREFLPWHEIPLAMEELEDGRLAIPLLEYPVQHIEFRRHRNADLENTNLILEIPVQTKSESEGIVFNKTQFVRPEALRLSEVFPANFFSFADSDRPGQGDSKDAEEWYFLETTIAGTGRFEAATGMINNSDYENRPASMVYFRRSEDGESVQIRNAYTSKDYDDEEGRGSTDNSVVMSMDAEFFDLRLKPDGEDPTIQPEKRTDREVSLRDFVELKLSTVSDVHLHWGRKIEVESSEVSEITVEDGYFSFILDIQGTLNHRMFWWGGPLWKEEVKAKIKYSFYKKSQRLKDLASRPVGQRCAEGFEVYDEKTAYSSDFKRFGMFTVRERVLSDRYFANKPDAEKRFKVQRFNPKCPIVYHPSSNTKKVYYPQVRMSVERWAEALRKSGSDLKIVYDPTPAPIGDIRYNTVDLGESKYIPGWLGIAQTLSDAKSGQIIYAQAQTSMSYYKWIARRKILRYLRDKFEINTSGFSLQGVHGIEESSVSLIETAKLDALTRLNLNPRAESVIYDPGAKVPDLAIQYPVSTTGNIGRANNGGRGIDSPESERYNPSFLYLAKDSLLSDQSLRDFSPEKIGPGSLGHDHATAHSALTTHKCNHSHVDAEAPVGRMLRYIKKFCKVGNKEKGIKSLSEYEKELAKDIKSLRGKIQFGQKITDPGIEIELDSEIINTCASNMVEGADINDDGVFVYSDVTVDTNLHEIGHNLALRHNFAGSSDKDNHYTEQDKKDGILPEEIPLFPTSTVMDYLPDEQGRPLYPGKYDVAALRFIYEDKVQSKETGEFKKLEDLDTDGNLLPIAEQSNGTDPVDYSFCSDGTGHYFALPMCAPHDLGTTPTEIVAYYKDRFVQALKNNRLRYDSLAARRIGPLWTTFVPMLRIYEEWRHLLLGYLSPTNQYLQEFKTDEELQAFLAEKLESVQRDETEKKKFENAMEYYEASKDAFDFLLNKVALMNNRYCVYMNNQGDSKIVELSFIREASDYGDKIVSCLSTPVQKYINRRSKEFAGYVLHNDVGYELWDGYYTKDVFNANGGRRRDVLWGGKDVAGTVTARVQAARAISSRFGLHPTSRQDRFYPSMMDEPLFRDQMKKAVLDRVHYGVKIPGDPKDKFHAAFMDEKPLLEEMYLMFRRGISIPGFGILSGERQKAFDIFMTSNNPERFALASEEYGSMYLAAMKHESIYSRALISQISLIKKLRSGDYSFERLSDQDLKPIRDAIIKATEPLERRKNADLKAGSVTYLYNVLEKNGRSDESLAAFVDMAFKSEMTLGEVTQDSGMAPDITSSEDLNVGSSYRRFDGQDIIRERVGAFNRESLLMRLEQAQDIYNRTVESYYLNPGEVTAQMEVIGNALIRRSYYVGNL